MAYGMSPSMGAAGTGLGFLGGPWGIGLGLGLSALGGMFAQDPMARQRKLYQQAMGQVNNLFDPNKLALGTQKRYDMLYRMASPQISALQGGQSAINNTLATQLGRRGLGSSGLGAAMQGAASGWYGSHLANLGSGLMTSAYDQENQARALQAQLIMNSVANGMQYPSMQNQLLAALLGTGGNVLDYAMRARLGH